MSNTDPNTPGNDDEYTGPAWYRPGHNRDLFLGLLVLGVLLGMGLLASRCDAGRDLAGRFGIDLDDGVTGDVAGDVAEDLGDNSDDVGEVVTVASRDLDADVVAALTDAGLDNVGSRVDGRTAVLTGVVASQAIKDDAEETALGVAGVDEVDNRIELDDAAPPADLEQQILSGLEADGIGGVDVSVTDGVATLTGNVESVEAKTQAGTLALAVEGVDSVNNELVVSDGTPSTDTEDDPPETSPTTDQAPPTDPPADAPFAVEGTVSGDVLTLNGSVPNDQVRRGLVAAAQAELGNDKVVADIDIDEELGDTGTLTVTGEVGPDQAGSVAAAIESAADAAGAELDNQTTEAEESAPEEVRSDLNAVLEADPILFEVSSAVVRPDSFPILDEIAMILTDNPGGTLVVEGHTDSGGDDRRNLRLSQDRAESVRTLLIERGVAADRLSPIGRGEQVPILDGAGNEDKTLSRRIVFKPNN